MAQAQEAIAELARRGRPGAGRSAVRGSEPATAVPTEAASAVPDPGNVELNSVMSRYEQFGDEPPKFTVALNDAAYGSNGAHTIDRHGPELPLPRDPHAKTIEGRIYGDQGWARRENWSLRWTDHTTMNREINNYVQQKWERIRGDLALDGRHERAFDAGHRVGVGYYNKRMGSSAPSEAQYTTASLVRIVISVVNGSDPPQPFIVTAYPAGVVPPGLL